MSALSDMPANTTGPSLENPRVTSVEPDGSEEYYGPMIDLSSLKEAVRRHRVACLAAAMVGLVLGAAFHLFIPPKYAAVTDLYMSEPSGADPAAALANEISLLETRSVAAAAIHALHLDVSPGAFLSSYQGSSSGSAILNIKFSAGSSAKAVEYDNALALAFLDVRAQELSFETGLVNKGLEAEVNSLNTDVTKLTNQISSLSSANAGSQTANQIAELVNQRSGDLSQIGQLQSQQQQDALAEQATAEGSRVLDPAVPVSVSIKKVFAEDGISGLIGGLAIAVGRSRPGSSNLRTSQKTGRGGGYPRYPRRIEPWTLPVSEMDAPVAASLAPEEAVGRIANGRATALGQSRGRARVCVGSRPGWA